MDAVRHRGPVEHPLHGELGFAVAVGGMRRVSLENRHALWLTIRRRRGREHDVLHTVLDHRLQHRPRAAEVVVVIFQGIDHALADLRVRGKVDDRVDLFAGKHMVAELLIADIALIEPRLRMHGLAETRLQVVCHDHIITVVDQLIYGVAADIARAAEY